MELEFFKNMDNPILELYAVRNKEGKYFRSKGYGGYGDTWVNDLKSAKIYAKLGQARARVTWFSTTYPKYGIPDICVLAVGSVEVLDETKRVEKAIQKKKVAKEKRELRMKKYQLERAQQEFKVAKQNLEKLTNG